MSYSKKQYRQNEWFNFVERVKKRDNYQCCHCGREWSEVVLQVHHNIYIKGDIWDSPLSDCITLCKGCHAKEHGRIEPTDGWTLTSIVDLGDLSGNCERSLNSQKECGEPIRYEHHIYHPKWGYKIVGSSCIDYLTSAEKAFAKRVLLKLQGISRFLHRAEWELATTTNKAIHLVSTYKNHHKIRIYGKDGTSAYQLGISIKGKDNEANIVWQMCVQLPDKTLIQAKEIAYIVLLGKLSKKEEEKEILRNIYINTFN